MKFSDERELFAAAADLHRDIKTLPVADRPRMLDYVDAVADNRWLIFLIMALALLLGGVTAVAMRPVYEANLLIQIADAAGPPKSLLGDAANVFDIKTPATAEMEIIRSRMIVGPAVEKNQLLVVARPRLWPIGSLRTDRSQGPPKPGLFNMAWDWIHGGKSIAVEQFEVPSAWENRTFTVRSEGPGVYTLRHPLLPAPIPGRVGEQLVADLGTGKLVLAVSQLQGDPGAEFSLLRKPRGEAIENLQDSLKIVERGRQSGIIEATLRDTDADRAAAILNTIGANYIRQDLDRKTAEAEKSLAFLNTQLPGLKQQVEQAESAYNAYRSRKGTVALQEEVKLALERTSQLNAKLLEAQQARRDMQSRYGVGHPAVRTLDEQISALEAEIRGSQGKIRDLPATEQGAQRLERDVKVSNDLYQQLRNSALQLQLVREGRTGNARIIDAAVPPDEPVRPKPLIVLGVALFAGAVLAFVTVLIRSGFARGVKSVREIELATSLNVYSAAIPLSRAQRKASARGSSRKLLALASPGDAAIESLRQLRTVLQHQMRDRKNNRLVITGAGEGVGVHFIASNLAAVFATGEKRILLIDADLRRRSLRQFFGPMNTPGLAELIAGTCTRKQATKPTAIPQLDFMPAGAAPLNPGDLAVLPAFLDMLDQASKEYDTVLLTAPPVLGSAETLSMASSAATVLLVTRARKTLVSEIAESARRLYQAGQFTNGVVLNGVK